jgi:hypothetical protein
MEIPKVLIHDLGRHDKINLYPFSDSHFGTEYADLRKVKDALKRVEDDPDGYILLIGDLLDMALRSSIGNVYMATMTPQEQTEYGVELLTPVKHKILSATEGNHEVRMIREVGFLPINNIIARLGLDVNAIYSVGAYMLFANWTADGNRTVTYSIYCKHGSGGGRTVGGKANALQRMKEDIVADVYIGAHTHQQMAFPSLIFDADTNHKTLTPRSSLHINSGTFLNWGGYAVEKGFPPSVTGAPVLTLWIDRVRGKSNGDRRVKRASVTISI